MFTLLIGLVGFALFYCFALFPYSYFRHDDWLVLGNALLRLPEDWTLAFKPTLFYANFEVPWFFRPFFKLLGYLFYQFFGYHYESWLLALLVLFLISVLLSAAAVRNLTASTGKMGLFVIFLLAPFHFHFGSLVWAGEGLMNVPQLFFLSLNLFLFVKGLKKKSPTARRCFFILAWFSYLPALGFKESSIFHPLLLPLIWPECHGIMIPPLKQRLRALSPYFSTLLVYLVFRLSMPWNPSYVAILKWQMLLRPLLTLLASFGLVLLGWMLALGLSPRSASARMIKAIRHQWLYLPFLGLVISPYLGHGFFSVGWLLLPGFYFALLLTLSLPHTEMDISPARLWRLLFSIGLCSFVASFLFLSRIDWWDWHRPQRATKAILERNGNRGFKKIVVFNCPNPRYPSADFVRVVAFNASLSFMWELFHKEKIDARVYNSCFTDVENRANYVGIPHTLYLDYRFPDVKQVYLSHSDLAETASPKL